MPAVSGVAKGAEIRIVWRNDDGAAAGRKQPVELFDRADDVGDVLDHVYSANFPK